MLRKAWKIFEYFILQTVGFIFKIIGKELTEEQSQTFIQFVKFCLVGVFNTTISLVTYYIFIAINKDMYILGNAVGFVVSVLNAYFWNSRFVFKKQEEKGRTVVKTFLAYGTNLVLGSVLLYLFIDVLHISEFIAPLIGLLITIPLNFLLNKFWVMKKKG